MIRVPLLDLKAQFAQIRAEVMPVIERVCASQQFILGEHVRALEAEIAGYCGASQAIGVSSGTDALLLALMALGIGAGDEVITSPFTFFATAGTIARSGARPVFCDIDPQTFNLSPLPCSASSTSTAGPSGGGLVHRATGGRDPGPHARAPVRPGRRHGAAASQIARRYGLARHRGCGAGDRHRDGGRRARRIDRATSAASRSSRARISAPSAMPACARPTIRSSPSACACCASTAASRSIFMRSSAAISASTNCRRRCCASS